MKNESMRTEVLEQYEKYARDKFTKEELHELVGKRLGCWCTPKPCHGDILMKLMKEYGAI